MIELLGRQLGLDGELASQDGDAVLVLAQRRPAAAELHVQPHQRPVHGFLQRIDRGELQRGLDGGLRAPGVARVREQSGQGLEDQLAQAFALGEQPVLEGRLGHREAGEQVPLVQGRRLDQSLRSREGDRLLERRHVHQDRGRHERHAVGVELKARAAGIPDRTAETEERLAETRASLRLRKVTPEETRELVPRVRLAKGNGEVGEQGLGLARRQAQRAARLEPGAKTTEQLKARRAIVSIPCARVEG